MPSPRKTLLCHYRYDPLDRLVGRTPADAPQLQRFYCKSRMATEIQGAMQHSIVQYGDLLLAQQQRQVDELETRLLATDQQRSVLHTLKANHPPQPFAYSPYGHRAENGLLSLLGFNGERSDPLTGHYLLGNGYRAFNPVLMRFNSPDRSSPFGRGGVNSYMYCSGDPINLYDPNGESAIFRFFSNAYRRINTTYNSIFRNYKSGPETTFTTTTTTTTTTHASGPETIFEAHYINDRSESIKTFDASTGKHKTRSTMKDNHPRSKRKNSDGSTTYMQPNPTLKELSYSKLTTSQIDELQRNITMQEVDFKVDLNNFNTAKSRSYQKHLNNNIRWGAAVDLAIDETIEQTIQGKTLGVHPDKIPSRLRRD